jgi:hypothetical protein
VKSRDVTYFSCLFVVRYASDDKLYKRWPLDLRSESRITRNFQQLTELITAGVDFVNSLYVRRASTGCKCDVDDTHIEYDKAGKLWDFLLHSSIANYDDFVACLKKANQQLVAKILEDDVGQLITQVNRYLITHR